MTRFSTLPAEAAAPPAAQLLRPELPPADPRLTKARPRTARLDRRTRSILAAAAAAAVLVNAGAAWAYWQITESGTGTRSAGGDVEMEVRARSEYNGPLTPGRTGNLTVTLTNDYDVPIKITRVIRGQGDVHVDDEHRAVGCPATAVLLSRDAFEVIWRVPRNTVGAFTVPGGVAVARDAYPACAGATFTLPVRVRGTSST